MARWNSRTTTDSPAARRSTSSSRAATPTCGHAKRDGREVFDVKNRRHLDYWINQPVDVYLVIRQTDERSGEETIRWMNVTRYLKDRKDKTSRQIVFEGERLDMQAVWKLRDRFFSPRRGDGAVGQRSGAADVADLPDLYAVECLQERRDQRQQIVQLRSGSAQHHNAQLEGRERLLIGQVLVSGHKDVEFGFGEPQQLPVLDLPAQPASATVRTSNPGSSRFSRRGRFSSRRARLTQRAPGEPALPARGRC